MYVDYLVIKWASFEYSLESSCVWLLGVESRDFSQAEKERTHKMTTIFTQNGPRLSLIIENSCLFVNLLSFANSYFFLSLKKIT